MMMMRLLTGVFIFFFFSMRILKFLWNNTNRTWHLFGIDRVIYGSLHATSMKCI
jgi:hypothetical protein